MSSSSSPKRPQVEITHNDVKEPEYDLQSLKDDLARSKQHTKTLKKEIENQQQYQKQLKSLIQKTKKQP